MRLEYDLQIRSYGDTVPNTFRYTLGYGSGYSFEYCLACGSEHGLECGSEYGSRGPGPGCPKPKESTGTTGQNARENTGRNTGWNMPRGGTGSGPKPDEHMLARMRNWSEYRPCIPACPSLQNPKALSPVSLISPTHPIGPKTANTFPPRDRKADADANRRSVAKPFVSRRFRF